MQSLLRRTPHSLPAPLRPRLTRISRPSVVRRSFASNHADDPADKETPTREHIGSGRRPLAAFAVILMIVPGYYFLHADRVPNNGNAAIKAARRENGSHNEYRDPRDSGVKTLDQKKARDAAQ